MFFIHSESQWTQLCSRFHAETHTSEPSDGIEAFLRPDHCHQAVIILIWLMCSPYQPNARAINVGRFSQLSPVTNLWDLTGLPRWAELDLKRMCQIQHAGSKTPYNSSGGRVLSDHEFHASAETADAQLTLNSDRDHLDSHGMKIGYKAMFYLVAMLHMDGTVVGAEGTLIDDDMVIKATDPSVSGLYFIIALLLTLVVLMASTAVVEVKCPSFLLKIAWCC